MKHPNGAPKQQKVDLVTIDIARSLITGNNSPDDEDNVDDDNASNMNEDDTEVRTSRKAVKVLMRKKSTVAVKRKELRMMVTTKKFQGFHMSTNLNKPAGLQELKNFMQLL